MTATAPTPRGTLALIGALFAGCGSVPEPPVAAAAEVIVRGERGFALPAGGSLQLSAQVNDAVGRPVGGAPISFRSSDPAVAQVTASGLVRSPGPAGAARIEVRSGAKSSEVEVRVEAGSPARLVLVGSGQRRGPAGKELERPIAARLEDGRGNPIEGAEVRFTAAAGAGTLREQRVRTDAQGTARTAWTLGPRAGAQRVSASAGDVAPAAFDAEAEAGPAATLVLSAPAAAPVAGGEIAVAAAVRDDAANPVSGVQVTFGVADGGAVEPGRATTDGAGIAKVRWTSGPRAGINKLLAETAGVPSVHAELAVTSTAGPVTRLEVSQGDGQAAVTGRAVRIAPAVRAIDAHGNPVAGVRVTFAVAAGKARPPTAHGVTGDDGKATLAGFTPLVPGGVELVASAEGVAERATFRLRVQGR